MFYISCQNWHYNPVLKNFYHWKCKSCKINQFTENQTHKCEYFTPYYILFCTGRVKDKLLLYLLALKRQTLIKTIFYGKFFNIKMFSFIFDLTSSQQKPPILYLDLTFLSTNWTYFSGVSTLNACIIGWGSGGTVWNTN